MSGCCARERCVVANALNVMKRGGCAADGKQMQVLLTREDPQTRRRRSHDANEVVSFLIQYYGIKVFVQEATGVD
jgi:hypothetical protein